VGLETRCALLDQHARAMSIGQPVMLIE